MPNNPIAIAMERSTEEVVAAFYTLAKMTATVNDDVKRIMVAAGVVVETEWFNEIHVSACYPKPTTPSH